MDKPTQFFFRSVLIVLFFALTFIGKILAQENADCFTCHEDKSATGKRKGKIISIFVDEKKLTHSVHQSLSCIACHSDLEGKEFPHDDDLKPVTCGNCHSDEQTEHSKSLHGKAIQRGDPLAPKCSDCHGNHEILSASNNNSPTSPLKIPFTCGKCHQEGAIVQQQKEIHQDHILENFSE
ncbi:MAG: hypothetical protein HYZ33_04895, partial [Ignavibacteriales bacterium]|nr:hypothetical protein [Ignavibacteriales bacterium]